MSKKFSLKKFNKDRDKSYNGSKNGDYKFIEHNEGRSNLVEIVTNIRDHLRPIECEHLEVGCRLPFIKRNMPKCDECYHKK